MGNADLMRLSILSRAGGKAAWTATRQSNSQGGATWTLEGRSGTKVIAAKAEQILNAVSELAGTDFLSAGEARDAFASLAGSVILSLTDDRTFTILFGAKRPDGQYPCMLEQGAHAYLALEWRLQAVMVPENALIGQ